MHVARRQHGLLTRAQILRVLTTRQLDGRVAAGRLERVRPRVYRVAGAPETWEQAVLGAVLAAGHGAFASCTTAAALWGLPGFEVPLLLEVTTPSRRRVRLAGVVVHDTQVLGRRHVTVRDRVPVASAARTLNDLTACAGPTQVARALDDALRRRLTTLATVTRVFDDLATRGRRRSTVMRALLAERAPGSHPGESDPERRLARTLVAAGLPPPAAQHRVRVRGRSFRLDLAYPAEKVGIEYDGWGVHSSRTAFDADRERDALLEVAGWLVLYFTSRSSDAFVVDTVVAALARRASPGRGPRTP